MSSVIAEPCVDHMDQERIDADPRIGRTARAECRSP
jgi:hypothetical protein